MTEQENSNSAVGLFVLLICGLAVFSQAARGILAATIFCLVIWFIVFSIIRPGGRFFGGG